MSKETQRRDGRTVFKDGPYGICVHLVGTTPGMWCSACEEECPR